MIEMGNIHDISHQKAYIFLFMLEYFFFVAESKDAFTNFICIIRPFPNFSRACP